MLYNWSWKRFQNNIYTLFKICRGPFLFLLLLYLVIKTNNATVYCASKVTTDISHFTKLRVMEIIMGSLSIEVFFKIFTLKENNNLCKFVSHFSTRFIGSFTNKLCDIWINLLAFYHEGGSLYGYATLYSLSILLYKCR